jgi:hypothetical protein
MGDRMGMSELQRSIALLFRRKGKEILTEKEFVFSASMDLRWFSPKEAQKLLDFGISGGYLQKKNGNIIPTFDTSVIEVPLDYKPGKDIFEHIPRKPQDLFSEIVDKIVKTKSVPKREVVSRVNKKQELLGIDVEPAALLVASDYGLLMDNGVIERAESEILNREI